MRTLKTLDGLGVSEQFLDLVKNSGEERLINGSPFFANTKIISIVGVHAKILLRKALAAVVLETGWGALGLRV